MIQEGKQYKAKINNHYFIFWVTNGFLQTHNYPDGNGWKLAEIIATGKFKEVFYG